MSTIAAYVGDGSNRQFDITFPYRHSSTIKVRVNGVDVSYTFVTSSRIQTVATPAVGAAVEVYRDTPVSTAEVVFQDGQVFHADDVNDAVSQPRDRAEELGSELGASASRALRVPIGETALPVASLADASGKVLIVEGGEVKPKAAVEIVASYVSALATLGDAAHVFRTKAAALVALSSLAAGAVVQVLVDESKNGHWSVYQKKFGVFEYLFSLASTSDERVAASGVLFDTDGADNFTDLLYTPNAALTVTSTQAAFSSATPLDIVMSIPAKGGVNPLYFCSDHWDVDATFVVTSFPAAGLNGARAGGRYYNPATADGVWGAQIASHGSSASDALVAAIAGDTVLEYTGAVTALPHTVRVRYSHDLPNNLVTHTLNIDGGADIQLTEPYGSSVSSTAPPVRFLSGVLRWLQGTMTCTKLKLSLAYPNARYACIGDSLTVGASASPLSNGFAHLLRADHPGQVQIHGASGSTTVDWQGIVESVVRVNPRNAIICLGTNDRLGALSVATSQTALTAIVNALVAAEIAPIILSSPPTGSSDVLAFNAWIQAQGWRYVDIFSTLVDVDGVTLKAAYWDGVAPRVHWNNAGHAAVYNVVKSYLTAEGL